MTDLDDIRGRLADRADTLAEFLLGPPNRGESTARQLRFGRHGSVAVELAGDRRGLWVDHSAGVGGDLLRLVQVQCQVDFRGALSWARQWLGDPTTVATPPRPAPVAEPEHLHETLSPWGRDLWASALPISPDCPAGRYLLGRRCFLPEPHACRWVPSLRYEPDGASYPALLSLITDATDADPRRLRGQRGVQHPSGV